MSYGFCINKRAACVDSQTVEAFRQLPVANVSDCMSRLYAAPAGLKPIHTHQTTLAGPALTVRTRPGDNLLLHHAIDSAAPGDVIVVDAGGETSIAIMGELMAGIAAKNQVAGIVIYGAIRDALELQKLGLPVYALGVTHRGPYKDGPGSMNTSISLGGMPVEPGDLILGDADGVLCVPLNETVQLLAAAREKYAAEQAELEAIAAGTVDRSWVVQTLKARGCTFED